MECTHASYNVKPKNAFKFRTNGQAGSGHSATRKAWSPLYFVPNQSSLLFSRHVIPFVCGCVVFVATLNISVAHRTNYDDLIFIINVWFGLSRDPIICYLADESESTAANIFYIESKKKKKKRENEYHAGPTKNHCLNNIFLWMNALNYGACSCIYVSEWVSECHLYLLLYLLFYVSWSFVANPYRKGSQKLMKKNTMIYFFDESNVYVRCCCLAKMSPISLKTFSAEYFFANTSNWS